MAKIKVTPWQPKITEPIDTKPIYHLGNATAVRILATLSELRGRWSSTLGKLSSPVRQDLGQGGGKRATRFGW